MGVGGVRGGGKKGGAGGVKGGGPVGGAKGAGFAGKVGKNEAVEGVSGAVGSGNVGNVQAADPITATAMDIARQLKSGQIKTKEEATQKLVGDILREKVRMQSRALTQKIADQLQDDPRLNAALDRLWGRAEE
jgi:hypothetical protein